jgi:hypothetical protein
MSFINVMGKMIRRTLALGRKGRRAQGRSSPARNGSRPHQRRPWLEELESRLVPTVTVSVIASVLTAQCDSGTNVVNVDHAASAAVVNGQSFADATYTSIRINGSAGGTTANIHANAKPLTFFGGAGLFQPADTVNVGEGGNVMGILGTLTVEDPPGFATLNVNDQSDERSLRATIDNFTTPGDTEFGRIVGLAPAAINFEIDDTNGVLVNTGTGTVTVNVLSTGQIRDALTLSGHALNTTVNVGNNGSVQGIRGPLHIQSAPSSYTALSVDDSADPSSWTPTLSEFSLTDLAPAAISYQQSGLRSLDVHLGNSTWGNQLTVTNTPLSDVPGGMMTTITTGTAAKALDNVYVQATTGPLTVNLNNNGLDPASGVLLGYPAGTLDNIQSPVTVNTSSGFTGLALFDDQTAAGQTYIVTANSVSRSGQLMATYHITNELFLYASKGTNTINVQSTSQATVINAGWSDDTINVGDTANTLNNLSGGGGGYLAFQINNPGSTIIFNDQGSTASRTYTLTTNTQIPDPALFVSGVQNEFVFAGPLAALVFNGSGGSDIYAIETTFTDTTIYAGAGSVNIFQISPVAKKLENIVGALTIYGGGNDTLDFYDTNNTNNEVCTFTPDDVPSNLTLASDSNFSVNWTGMESVHLFTNGHSTVHDLSGLVLVDQ